MSKAEKIPIWEKFLLTVPEASEYFCICEKRLRQLVNENQHLDFVLFNGKKVLIKRKKFEEFLNSTTTI